MDVPTLLLRTLSLALCAVLLPTASPAQETVPDRESMIQDAISAAPATVAVNATVMDWNQNVLRQGTNGWVCFPTPPQVENGPLCLDQKWVRWADAWMNKKPVNISGMGLAYMLQGDSGASNTDPFATAATPDNDWVVAGPHMMVIVPDPKLLEGIPTDPSTGGPWVMWKGTPYVHVMVPVH